MRGSVVIGEIETKIRAKETKENKLAYLTLLKGVGVVYLYLQKSGEGEYYRGGAKLHTTLRTDARLKFRSFY